ncbi:MAG TPA: MFS transporter [Rhizobiales bacterium]|nr:MFS transporter [Hyphomicrobiales bacterium]
MPFSPQKPISTGEFISLLAMMISIVALSTDVMLPGLGVIGRDLAVSDVNDSQLVISSLFAGYAVGQMLAGPVSDCYGRKPVIYAGYMVFIIGCLLSAFASSFSMMLIGRVLQGLGAAAPRIVSIALVRDGYEGRAMARIMSFVLAVFVIVPAIAPAIGQGVMMVSGWRMMFGLLIAMAVVSAVWFAWRQPETLPRNARRDFSIGGILSGISEACRYRTAVGYTLAAGLIFGAFLGYLSSARQIFQTSFNTGSLFPLYFGTAALAIGAASVLNGKLVMRLGMRLLTHRALIATTLISMAMLIAIWTVNGIVPLWLFMTWLLTNFFCMGILFGNLNALAMEPLGHMAGLGAALIGAISTFIALPLGWAVGNSFTGGVTPLVAGFALMGGLSWLVMAWTEAKPQGADNPQK